MREPTGEAPSTAPGSSEVVMEASPSRVLVGEFPGDQDSAPEEAVCPGRTGQSAGGRFVEGEIWLEQGLCSGGCV